MHVMVVRRYTRTAGIASVLSLHPGQAIPNDGNQIQKDAPAAVVAIPETPAETVSKATEDVVMKDATPVDPVAAMQALLMSKAKESKGADQTQVSLVFGVEWGGAQRRRVKPHTAWASV